MNGAGICGLRGREGAEPSDRRCAPLSVSSLLTHNSPSRLTVWQRLSRTCSTRFRTSRRRYVRLFPVAPPPPSSRRPRAASGIAQLTKSSAYTAQPLSSLHQLLAAEEEDSKVGTVASFPLRLPSRAQQLENLATLERSSAHPPKRDRLVGRHNPISRFDRSPRLAGRDHLHPLVRCCRRRRPYLRQESELPTFPVTESRGGTRC